MKKLLNEGFTLIELLAVIVILAVIALISIPIIGGILEQSKVEAYKDSVLGAFEATEYYVLNNNLNNIPENGIEVKDLSLKANNFISGRIIQNDMGQLVAENISNGEYCANGLMDELSIEKGDCGQEIPQINISANGKIVTIALKSDQGVVSYAIVKKGNEISGWTNIEEAVETTVEWIAEEAGSYVVYVKDKNGKISEKEFTMTESAFCTYTVGDLVQTYNEKENAVEFVIPCSGVYNLDAYGAQGSDYGEYTGGLGGETTGNFYFEKGDVLTISVGGQDGTNGGGTGSSYGNGGGYTKVTSETGETLLVAAGGGGASPAGNGGNGGDSAASLVTDSSVGETGFIGGGGGYLGGQAGHLHVYQGTLSTHDGETVSDTSYGCYTNNHSIIGTCTISVSQGSQYYNAWTGTCPSCGATESNHSGYAYHPWTATHSSCGQSSSSGWWNECVKCGGLVTGSKPSVSGTHTYEEVRYSTACGKTEQSASGGSNYIATSLAQANSTGSLAGVQSGDGQLNITLVSF